MFNVSIVLKAVLHACYTPSTFGLIIIALVQHR